MSTAQVAILQVNEKLSSNIQRHMRRINQFEPLNTLEVEIPYNAK